MSNFSIYYNIGFNHIANIGALDHILFMIALVLRYEFKDWKKLLLLITSFTIGHCISLTLSVIDFVDFSKNWIEFIIPITIAITAFSNLFDKSKSYKNKFPIIYWFALVFGIIHGLGFSGDLKLLIGNSNLFIKLFAANLGIETAQIILAISTLLLQLICTGLIKINKREYVIFISGFIIGIALYIAAFRLPI